MTRPIRDMDRVLRSSSVCAWPRYSLYRCCYVTQLSNVDNGGVIILEFLFVCDIAIQQLIYKDRLVFWFCVVAVIYY